MQSSPSPTSIITSINQSNYLCSQTPDPQSTSTPQIIPYKDTTAVFQRPTKNMADSNKQASFKQVYIAQRSENNVTDMGNCTPQRPPSRENYAVNRQMDVTYKRIEIVGDLPAKQENYDFKNLAINNYIQRYSNGQEIFQKQQLTNELYSQNNLKNPYGEEKLKFYLSTLAEHGVRLQTTQSRNVVPPVYAPAPHSQEYTGNHKTTTEKTNGPSDLQTSNTNRPFAHDHETGKDTSDDIIDNKGEDQK